jgi:hypothetical protein
MFEPDLHITVRGELRRGQRDHERAGFGGLRQYGLGATASQFLGEVWVNERG